MPFLSALADALSAGLFQVQNQTLLRAIIDNLSEGVIIADAEGSLVYLSPSARTFHGMGFERMGAPEWREHFHVFDSDTLVPVSPEELPLAFALRGEAAPTRDLLVKTAPDAEGQHMRVSARTLRDPQGKLMGAIVFMRDISRERQAQADQRRAENHYLAILEAVQEGIWKIDAEGRTTYVNGYMAQMLGYAVEEMRGGAVLDFIAEDSRERVTNNLVLRSQGVRAVHDLPLRHKQGQTVWTMISSNPQHDEQGRYLGSLAAVTDITRRREAEQRILQLNQDLERRIAERTTQLAFSNQELEAFAYSVAHDLRAPLRSISNFSLVLSQDCAEQLDATGQNYLQRIRAAAQRMSELIDGILELSRVNRTGLQEKDVDLSRLARSTTDQLQRLHPERTARCTVQEGLVDRGDSRLLRSVLENLLGNAWKFTRERPVAEIEFGRREEGGRRIYFVRDNGAGFDMEYRAKLFGVFQRLHTQQEFEGTGVGLATVQRIIRRHGGHVWGEGRVGQGATFSFTLHDSMDPLHG